MLEGVMQSQPRESTRRVTKSGEEGICPPPTKKATAPSRYLARRIETRANILSW